MTYRLLLRCVVLGGLALSPARGHAEPAGSELPPLPETLDLPDLAPLDSEHSEPQKHWLSHAITLDASIWPGQLPARVDPLWFELSYRPRLAGELGAGVALSAEILLRASQGKRASKTQLKGQGNSFRAFSGGYHGNADRQAVLIKEAQLSWVGHGLELIAGYQILSWGKADGVRPLNVFGCEDLSDPLRPETLGLPAISASYGRSGVTVEGIWVPFAFSNRLATDPTNVFSIVPRVPGARFRGNRRTLSLRDGELGFRATYSNQAWDLSLQTSRTRERSPSLLRLTPDAARAELTVTPVYLRHWTHGVSVVHAIGKYLLKADLAYVDYSVEQGSLIKDGVRLVTGAEARGQIAANGTYTVILQYALDTTTPGKIVQKKALLSSPYRWFRHALVGSAHAIFSPRFEAELSAFVELGRGSAVASATLTYHPTDDTSLWCEGAFVTGRKDTWIGRLESADRIVVGLAFNTQS